MITLFDEYGTPTLRQDRENEIFVGVAVSYKKSDEYKVFDKIETLIGLNNNQPMKNAQITNNKAIKIAEVLSTLPISIAVITIDLHNISFIETITKYHQISNKIRSCEREVRDRPIAQIIHSKVLSNCLFEAITLCLETSTDLNEFDVFIDNWAIKAKDISIYLQYRSESLSKNIRRLYPKVAVKPIELLEQDTKRKRFIDSVTSVVSRNFYNKSIDTINVDITEKETKMMNQMLNEFTKKANKTNTADAKSRAAD